MAFLSAYLLRRVRSQNDDNPGYNHTENSRLAAPKPSTSTPRSICAVEQGGEDEAKGEMKSVGDLNRNGEKKVLLPTMVDVLEI